MSESKTIEERIIELITPSRAFFQNDGGDVTFKSLDKKTGKLILETSGHCLGCTSCDFTNYLALKEYIKANFDEVKEVIYEPKKVV